MYKNTRQILLYLTVFSYCLLTACDSGFILGGDDNWVLDAPENHGVLSADLTAAASLIGQITERQCLVIIKDGVLIHESYYKGDEKSRNYGYSSIKSFAATVVGIAAYQGYLSLDDNVSMWVPNHTAQINPDATIRHLLGQVSQSYPVGSVFKYNSSTVVDTLGQVIQAATNRNPVEFAYTELFQKTGIFFSSWGNGFNSRLPIGSGGHLTCRDMARLGQLYLNGGSWDGVQILAPEFVYEATHPSYPEANAAYGYLWWVNQPGANWYRPITQGVGQIIPNAPDSMYLATGLFGQIIMVTPETNVVITTAGLTPEPETLNTAKEVWGALKDVL